MKTIPEDIKLDLLKACTLHERTSSDFAKCTEFSKLMSDLLGRLEDNRLDSMADKVMSILIECNPKEGANCDNSMRVGDKMRKIAEILNNE